MLGRKVRTPPTPATIPSTSSDNRGAGQVAGENELHDRLHRIFTDAPLHRSMAHAAKACVDGQRGVIDRHLAEIGSLVAGTSRV